MDLNGTKVVECHECKGTIFNEGVMVLKKSKFATGDNEDTIIQMPVLYCKSCGEMPTFLTDKIDDILNLEHE